MSAAFYNTWHITLTFAGATEKVFPWGVKHATSQSENENSYVANGQF